MGIALPFLMIALIGFTTSITAHADVFILEKRQTDVRFVCGMGLVTVEGRFLDVDGVIDVDEKAREHGHVQMTIKSASLTTGLPLLDQQLKGDQFFNVAAYPTIDFKGRVTTSKRSTEAKIRGKLSIRGVTRPISIRASASPPDKDFFLTRFPIRRSEFGMTGWAFLVDDECEIQIKAALKKHR